MKKQNKTKIKVKGLNQERALNELIKEIKIYNYKRVEHNLSEFEVEYKDYRLLKKRLAEFGLEILSISHHGLKFNFKKLLCSYGLIAALLICSVLYAFQYNFILKIDVFGATSASQISKFIKNSLKTRYKGKIDTDNIEILIKENFANVSSVSVAIVGQSLVINVIEGINPDDFEKGNEIRSSFDGLITEINLVQGTLAVEVGDVVKKDDVLVYPYIIDAEGEKREVAAKAEIFADIWLSGRQIHYDYSILTKRTGKKIIKNEVYLGSLLLYSNSKEVNFEHFEFEEKEKMISKNNMLPITRKVITYYETTVEEIFNDFNLIKDEQIEKAKEKALIFLLKDEIIKEENFYIREGGSIHEVEYVLTVNRNIGG